MGDSQRLSALLTGARRILVFTGAGISTASGIPDFRGPRGVWQKRQPVYFDEFLESAEKRVEYWDYKSEGYEGFCAAQPNPAHHAIVRLEQLGRVIAVVTQNIDGLHQKAGSNPDLVIEIHGSNAEVECVSCWRRSSPAPAVEAFRTTNQCPTCGECGGFLKFATISFGQSLDTEVLIRAAALAEQADLVLALGSTLAVSPANQIPLLAVERQAPYVIINQGETDHDQLATLRLEGDVGAILAPAVAALDD